MRRYSMRSVATALCATLAIAGLVACGSDDKKDSPAAGDAKGLPASIPVTLIQTGTGPLAFYGTQLTAGVKAGVEQVNASGVLGTSKIELTVQDNASTVPQTTTLFAAAAKSKAAAILGPSISSMALATAPVAQQEKVPYIVDTSTPDLLDAGEYVWSGSTPQSAQMAAWAPKIAETSKKIGFIYANDNPNTAAVDKSLTEQLKGLGVEITDNIAVPLASTDLAAVATKAIQGSPDAIGLISGGPQMPALVKALRVAGYEGKLFGNGGAGGTIDSAGAQANGFQYTAMWTPDLPGETSTKFADLFAKVNPGVTPHYPAIDGYNMVLFLANGLAKAGSVDRAAVNKGLQAAATEGFEGPGGKVTFGGTGNRQLLSTVVFAEFQDGKVRSLGTAAPKLD